MREGYIQVYTGNSKGKTTAALGLALRAAGAGMKVFIAQFVKKRKCSEHKALERFADLIAVKQYGTGFISKYKAGDNEHAKAKEAARKGLKEAAEIIASNAYNMVILDEINIAIHYRLINIKDLLDMIDAKPPGVEIVLTGRYADKKIIEKADLVTEMTEIKHYMSKGVKARKGVEW
ncbi:MAG: cob(I)yrinic acid a,c-diamide adenosyltransferase [Nitrospirae bacterium]|nr:cob(I)yrinic acid a,c-diamide adenosyltransferase [Nitrospirota bacterium]